jgi:hypothetical protein
MKTNIEKTEPPVILVKTWYRLMLNSEEKEAKERASLMMLNAFGDMGAAAQFIKKHNIV